MTEQTKPKRGRPRINLGIAGNGAKNRRTGLNQKYFFDGMCFVTAAEKDIPDCDQLWYMDDATKTARGKIGVLEQIGRMYKQDKRTWDDCLYVSKLAAQALKSGHKSKEVEIAVRKIRMGLRQADAAPDDPAAKAQLNEAVWALSRMK